MSVHDKAHELGRALRTSAEYQAFLSAKKQLDSDAAGKKMVQEFFQKKLAAEYDLMAGNPEDQAKSAELQKLYELIVLQPQARDFIHAHMRFQQIAADIYKIIGDAVAEGMDLFGKE
ncbi:YlbF family regulator [Sporomusa termitida]|uniref:Control of competence regulator ComK, YlbF/YmcA n=1 Tax=Sporomusa termitida TaxID=2377 RepID=A0A517DUP0_9FIRM|nr:YlbF family regulator [Sporomusa termitida]QDR81057.1 Control of competence regulator ComK, YlbF/YmcA [Sporomusa termitida]